MSDKETITTTTTFPTILSFEGEQIVIVINTKVEVKVKQNIFPTQEDLNNKFIIY